MWYLKLFAYLAGIWIWAYFISVGELDQAKMKLWTMRQNVFINFIGVFVQAVAYLLIYKTSIGRQYHVVIAIRIKMTKKLSRWDKSSIAILRCVVKPITGTYI